MLYIYYQFSIHLVNITWPQYANIGLVCPEHQFHELHVFITRVCFSILFSSSPSGVAGGCEWYLWSLTCLISQCCEISGSQLKEISHYIILCWKFVRFIWWYLILRCIFMLRFSFWFPITVEYTLPKKRWNILYSSMKAWLDVMAHIMPTRSK